MPSHTPGPRGWPLVGSLYALARNPPGFLQHVAQTYGDVARTKVAGRSYVLLSNPTVVDDVLVRHRDAFVRDRTTKSLEAVLGQGLLTSDGPVWKRQRRLIAPSFTPKQLRAYAATMLEVAEQHLPPPGDRDIHRDASEVALDIVIRTLFGTAPADEAEQVGPLLDRLMGNFQRENRSLWRMVPAWVPARHRQDVVRYRKAFRDLLDRLIARARAHGDDGDLLLHRLLAATDDSGHGMGDEQLRDELTTLFIAGHETTALSISYTLLLLAEHPEIQDRLHAELDAHKGPIDLDALRELPLLDAVLRESLRLYPPAWAFGREAATDLVIDGHPVAAGEQVIVCPWAMHRDPRWWTGPERFRPDRWLNGETDAMPKGAFMPFGGGPRVCVGQHFAMMELALVVATWLRHIRVRSWAGPLPELLPVVTLRPINGIRVVVHEREKGHPSRPPT